MEKYTIPGKQVSFRLTDDQKDTLQGILNRLQTATHNHYSSMREAVNELINNYVKLEEELDNLQHHNDILQSQIETLEKAEPQPEAIKEIPDALQGKFDQLKEDIFENEEVSEIQMIEELINMINTPAPAVEIPVEKIVEVEKKLEENQLLVNLKPQENKLLENIASWRLKSKLDDSLLTKETVVKKLAFNLASLANWNDEFRTGISERSIKRMMRTTPLNQ